MLTSSGQELPSAAMKAVEERVRRLIMETAGWGATTEPLLGAPLDSLTLIAIVTRIEAAFGVSFESDEIVALLGARDTAAIAELVVRKLGGRHEYLDESTRNDRC